MRLSGKIAIVTGAASGIGAAIARRLAADGAILVLGDRNIAGLEQVAKSIGPNAAAFGLDVTDSQSCQHMVEAAAARHGRLDILCNVAGILDFSRLEDLDHHRWDKVISVNLTGVYQMSRCVMPHLVKTQGTIINMASAAGLVGVPFNAAYTASKHGVIGLTRSLALEFSGAGVRVNAICPDGVKTPMLQQQWPENIDWGMVLRSNAWLEDGAMAEPEEIAETVAFLALSQARRITGAAITVDGGLTAS